MSTSAAIALIIATFFLGGLSFFWLSKLANDVAAEIVTGVVRGVPVSIKYRRLLLYQTWVNLALASLAFAAFAVVAVLIIGDYAPDSSVKPLAYLAAFMGAVTVVASLPTYATEFLAFRSTLRQAEGS